MSVKIKKAVENGLYTFEKCFEEALNIWSTQIEKNLKEQERLFRESIVKTCMQQFSKDFEINEKDTEILQNKLKESVMKHKLGKIMVSCPNFVMNHQHTEKDVEDSENKKFLFELKKKKDTVRKPRQTVSAYQLWQLEEREQLKKDNKNPQEIREHLKEKWAEFKQDNEKFKDLEKKAKQMKEKPEKKETNNGLGRTAYHLFSKYEKKLYSDDNPDATKQEVNKYVSEKWKAVKENPAQYNEYLLMAQEEAEEKNKKKNKNKTKKQMEDSDDEEEKKEDSDEEEKPKKKQKAKKVVEKKEDEEKPKRKQKPKIDEKKEESDDDEDDVIQVSKPKDVKDDASEEELNISDIEYTDSD